MATSLIGPRFTDRALTAAPVPRPPQPISATLIVWLSAAWTCGRLTPASAEAAAACPVAFRNLRRVDRFEANSFMVLSPCRGVPCEPRESCSHAAVDHESCGKEKLKKDRARHRADLAGC